VKDLGFLMTTRTEADSVLFDVPAVGHQVPVYDVMRVKHKSVDEQVPPTGSTLVLVTGKDCLTEVRTHSFLVVRHVDPNSTIEAVA